MPVRQTALMRVLIVATFAMPAAIAQGVSDGPNNPATGTNTAGPFVKPWVNPGNVSANDGLDAVATVTAPLQETDFLDATDFGFALPGDRAIKRIDVRITGRSDALVSTIRVRLLKNGNPVGAPMTAFIPAGASNTTLVFSDQDNVLMFGVPQIWGTSWTPADINNAGFGVRVDCETISGTNIDFEIDNIRVQVFSLTLVPAAHQAALGGLVLIIAGIGCWLIYRRSAARRSARLETQKMNISS